MGQVVVILTRYVTRLAPQAMKLDVTTPADGTIAIRLVDPPSLDKRIQQAKYVLTDPMLAVTVLDIPRGGDGHLEVPDLRPHTRYSVSAYFCAAPDPNGKGGGCTNATEAKTVTTWPKGRFCIYKYAPYL